MDQNPIDIIIKLVIKGEIDPWNIDINVLAEKYIKEIKNMYIPDFITASKVLIAASLLLKLKAESLKIEEDESENKISKKRIFGIKRFYTLDEIALILKEYTSPPLEYKPSRRKRESQEIKPKVRKNNKQFDYNLHKAVLEDAIKYLEEEIKNFPDLIKFSDLNYPTKPQAFVALLFLDYDNKINLIQEEAFEEIYIEKL